MVQWLRLHTPTAGGMGLMVRSLVGELRSFMPHSTAKKKKKKTDGEEEILEEIMKIHFSELKKRKLINLRLKELSTPNQRASLETKSAKPRQLQ